MPAKRFHSKPADPLVGMYVHTMKDGRIEKQGKVIDADGRLAYVQLFSFVDGEETHTMSISKRALRSAECRLYASSELMRYAYDIEERKYRAQDERDAKKEFDRQLSEATKRGHS